MTTDSAPEDGCGSCLSRRSLMGAALAAGGAAFAGGLAPAGAVSAARWITLGNHGRMGVGECRKFVQDGRAWMVTRVGRTRYRAFQGLCPHEQYPLLAGARRIVCAGPKGHDSTFSKRTGEVLQGPARRDLREFRTRIRNGRVQIYA